MNTALSQALRVGGAVGAVLAAFTVGEYFFATGVEQDGVRVIGLFAVAIIKAYLIILFFMHLKRAWQPEAH